MRSRAAVARAQVDSSTRFSLIPLNDKLVIKHRGSTAVVLLPALAPGKFQVRLANDFYDSQRSKLTLQFLTSYDQEHLVTYLRILDAYADGADWQDVASQVLHIDPRREPESARSALQSRVELQADCFAGIWANRAQQKWQFIEPGDVEAALQTASAIGDDRLQRESQGYVVPDAFTHGTSAQRTRWFMTGLKSGEVGSCDTFRTQHFDWIRLRISNVQDVLRKLERGEFAGCLGRSR